MMSPTSPSTLGRRNERLEENQFYQSFWLSIQRLIETSFSLDTGWEFSLQCTFLNMETRNEKLYNSTIRFWENHYLQFYNNLIFLYNCKNYVTTSLYEVFSRIAGNLLSYFTVNSYQNCQHLAKLLPKKI